MANRIALNETAPNFSLPDLNGKTVQLADFRNNKHIVLVFNRGFV